MSDSRVEEMKLFRSGATPRILRAFLCARAFAFMTRHAGRPWPVGMFGRKKRVIERGGMRDCTPPALIEQESSRPPTVGTV